MRSKLSLGPPKYLNGARKFELDLWSLITANPAKNEITFDQWVGAEDLDGQGYAIIFTAIPGCGGPCSVMTNPYPPTELVEGEYKRVHHELSGQLSGTQVEVSNGISPEAELVFIHPRWQWTR
ncbi:hypothetical protein AB0K12_42365 [Nonomuraea sp. NPDC049419]|uniref:hypothetical protein n=1 Tax=Nonomuraea sp. NPDC049419 TaxID=3155772 RepID=UPI00342EEFB7